MKVLDKAWTDCERMWKWIPDNLPEGFSTASLEMKSFVVDALKKTWLKNNRFTKPILCDCFFCEYDRKHNDDCSSCPARLVKEGFHCSDIGTNFRISPGDFYLRVKKLNKIRKG